MSRDANHLAVERAIRAELRERFLPAADRARAHCDTALPIACGQTISQPSLVAYMTEQLELTAASRVLEVGTGSGYQAAILTADDEHEGHQRLHERPLFVNASKFSLICVPPLWVDYPFVPEP